MNTLGHTPLSQTFKLFVPKIRNSTLIDLRVEKFLTLKVFVLSTKRCVQMNLLMTSIQNVYGDSYGPLLGERRWPTRNFIYLSFNKHDLEIMTRNW